MLRQRAGGFISFLLFSVLTAFASTGPSQISDLPDIAQSQILAALGSIHQAQLLASDGQPLSFLGWSVAISGNTVVVGSPGYNDGFGNYVPGYAYVFLKPADGWVNMLEIAELKASDGGNEAGNNFGQSVAIANDTVIVGCPGLSQVYIYVKPAGGWTNMTETAILRDPSYPEYSGFGWAVAIDATAQTVVVGAIYEIFNNGINGAGYVFLQPGNGWQNTSTPNALLTASDGLQNDDLGVSAAIEGNTIVLGASGKPYPQGYGTAYVYVKPAQGWSNMTQTAELTASSPQDGASLGNSVAIAGNIIAAGAPGGTSSQHAGNVFLYVEPSGGWSNMTETARVTDGNEVYDSLGASVSLTNSAVVAGAPSDNVGSNFQQGSAYVFLKPKAGWKSTSTFSARLTATYGTREDHLGTGVAAGSGTAVAGASGSYGGIAVGVGYVFFLH